MPEGLDIFRAEKLYAILPEGRSHNLRTERPYVCCGTWSGISKGPRNDESPISRYRQLGGGGRPRRLQEMPCTPRASRILSTGRPVSGIPSHIAMTFAAVGPAFGFPRWDLSFASISREGAQKSKGTQFWRTQALNLRTNFSALCP